MDGKKLSARHLADLRKSGLTEETIRISQAFTESDPVRIAVMLRWCDEATGEPRPAKGLGSCLVFPFLNVAGDALNYYRIKPDKPRVSPTGRPFKYESPYKTPNHVYLTPRAREYAKDASKPLIFTEGEKKALAADQAKYACVGSVGVWGWVRTETESDTGTESKLNADLDPFAWEGRRVYIAYDSDIVANPSSRHAEWRLAVALMELKACVRIIRLPQKIGAPKVGMDDYLASHGPDALGRLIENSAPPTRVLPGFANSVQMLGEKPGEFVDIPRSSDEMALELVGRSGGWPRLVSGALVIPDEKEGTAPIDDYNELFAFMGATFNESGLSGVRWDRGPKHVNRQEFYSHLVKSCERFDRSDSVPHVPAIPGILYTQQIEATKGSPKTLATFLDFFKPATDEDKTLLIAAMLTPLWGGPPGKRPAFLFEATEDDTASGRGVGKTTVAQKIAAIYGGAFDIDASEPFHRTRTRLLTPDAMSKRILLMDNVKTFRLSSADLESLVTAPNVNGHRMYKGQAAIPNYCTLFITLNGASLSKDFAQRVIPVQLKRGDMKEDWEATVDEFLLKNKTALIADLMNVLNRTPTKLSKVSRWGAWESGVLGKVKDAEKALKVIDSRTMRMDADKEDADRIREMFRSIVDKYDSLDGEDADKGRYLLASSAVTRLVELALGVNTTAAGASAQIKSLGMPEFRKSDRNGGRFWLWTGSKLNGKQSSLKKVTYNTESDKPTWDVKHANDHSDKEKKDDSEGV